MRCRKCRVRSMRGSWLHAMHTKLTARAVCFGMIQTLTRCAVRVASTAALEMVHSAGRASAGSLRRCAFAVDALGARIAHAAAGHALFSCPIHACSHHPYCTQGIPLREFHSHLAWLIAPIVTGEMYVRCAEQLWTSSGQRVVGSNGFVSVGNRDSFESTAVHRSISFEVLHGMTC